MHALLLGIAAALLWGVHDLCVRYVSQKSGVVVPFLTVLLTGAALVLPFAVFLGDWGGVTRQVLLLGTASGIAFAVGGLALYLAFSIGPVRLVAPIIGAYPILSVGWAAVDGEAVAPARWAAVLMIVTGVALVASLSGGAEPDRRRRLAVLASILAGIGFAATFALGQAAMRGGAELPVILMTRAVSVVVVIGVILAMQRGLCLNRRQLPLLTAMGALDASALALVTVAGAWPNPEFASVAASTFGMVTVVLAWAILREPMTRGQWGSVALVFGGLVWLGL